MADSDDQSEPRFPLERPGGPFFREMHFLEQRTGALRAVAAEAEHPGPITGDDPRTRHMQMLMERGALMSAGGGASPAAPTALRRATSGREPAVILDDFRHQRIMEFRRRHSALRDRTADVGVLEGAPLPAPANNWIPIGPFVMRQGQGSIRPAVSGRIAGLAVAPGGQRVYAGSANGGVWRSDDGGKSWISTMDGSFAQATSGQSDSLSVGAIALDHADPDRVYVGTGEGNTVFIQNGQVFGTMAFYGVGPVRTDDGGKSWHTEATAPGSPSLQGSAFYQLAVDPIDRERVVAATLRGIFRREPDGAGKFHWAQKLPGIFTSIQVARVGNTIAYFAAQWGGGIFRSPDGESWTSVPGFPSMNVGRVGLAVRPCDPSNVYALVARADNDHVLGVWRLTGSVWQPVQGVPTVLFGPAPNDPSQPGQGGYDLAIVVDPEDVDRIYIGGSTVAARNQWSGSVYRCGVTQSGTAAAPVFEMQASYVGGDAHADCHSLEFTPDDPQSLWIGCDGGVFLTADARGTARFESRNTGLATLTMNHLGVHPSEDAVLFCGTQDNGHARYSGEECWLHAVWGDGGYAVIHPRNPNRILTTYTYNDVNRAEDGGQGYGSWTAKNVPLEQGERVLFYAPLEGLRNPRDDSEARLVAFGSVRLWLSDDFGDSWVSLPDNSRGDDLDDRIRAITFASADRIYVGTMTSGVFRFDRAAGWAPVRLNPTVSDPGALPFRGVAVTAIAIDPADPSGGSIYITLAGAGDFRHVWHHDGMRWEPRSGPDGSPEKQLLDVQHNAIVADPANPSHLYVGADIGVWRSLDGGGTWEPFSPGLPDVAVFDLEIHPGRRLLWAATHGRGVHEYALDATTAVPLELYLRHTPLDRGRRRTDMGLPDPTAPGREVDPHASPDIKVDVPDGSGNFQTPTNPLTLYEFADRLQDRSAIASRRDASGNPLAFKVFVQIHNRGLGKAAAARVSLLAAPLTSASLPGLPPGYEILIQTGEEIATFPWITVGTQILDLAEVGRPTIASFDLTSAALIPTGGGQSQYALVALVHHADDAYRNSEVRLEELCVSERRLAVRILTVAET
jgi:hypothetical protein